MSGARAAALTALGAVVEKGRSLDAALESLDRSLPDGRERALARELCFGVLRWYPRLDALVDELLERGLRRRDRELRLVIALGLHQLFSTRVPAHAAVSESVDLARAAGFARAAGLVNAVLRRALRERVELEARIDHIDSARHAHPQWLIDRVRSAWPMHWEAILAAGNGRAPMTLRANAERGGRAALLERLAAAGLGATSTRHAAEGVTLDEPCPVETLPGFADGALSVQDQAAQLAAPLLGARPGQRILDACAAPGGKTAHILETAPQVGELVAVERDAARAERLRAALVRLDLTARVVVADAATPATWWDGHGFDRILLDAPCSATGVVRRHPDIKVLRRDTDPPRLAEQQHRLLEALWPMLNAGGKLLYATCSILPEENEHVIERFVGERPDAVPTEIDATWGICTGLGRQILPGEDAMDGFYYAAIERLG